jgi:peptidylprolyl isomerase
VKHRLYILGLSLLLLLWLAACGPAIPDESPTDSTANDGGSAGSSDNAGAGILDEEGGLVTDSGLVYIEIEKGSGPKPNPGEMVAVHYTGRLENGTEFDSSIGGTPFQFPLGMGQVIRGWDEGIALMNVGGKAELIIPPELGYGDTEFGPIPGNSTLYFEVELLDVQPLVSPEPPTPAAPPTSIDPAEFTETESGLRYAVMQAGEGDRPENGELVSIYFSGWVDGGTKFSQTQEGVPLTFIAGQDEIIPGFDEAVLLMQVGEITQFYMPADIALGAEGSGDGVIPPNATLIFEIELIEVSPPPPTPTPAPPPVSIAESDYTVTETGLQFAQISPGNGTAVEDGDTLLVHYNLWLEDGTRVDSSYDRGEPINLALGIGMVIPGWEEGLLLMEEGQIAQLVIPSAQAYGETGFGPIPPDAQLIFEVEVLEIVPLAEE